MLKNDENTHKTLIQQEPIDQYDKRPNDQGAKKVTRRTITIEDENERSLNQFRGWLLTEKNRDLEYTRAINLVLALGFNRMRDGNFTPKENKIVRKYFYDTNLQIESVDDEHWNQWMEHVYPEVMAKIEKLEQQKSKSNSVKRKKKDDVPEAEQQS
ncbi:MAG: hypothetical protein K5793_02530 [Nitrosarchaeum sp.]|nr:hypothetical protein [Nitrosarchaeum sp.]